MNPSTRIFFAAMAFAALATMPAFRLPAPTVPGHSLMLPARQSLLSLPIPGCGPGVPTCGGTGGGSIL